MGKININIRLHLLIALGSKEYIWTDIDRVYKENEEEYYTAYINGKFRKDIAKKRYAADVEEHIMKVMAINEWCEFDGDYTIINELIKKGYKKVWNYYKKASSDTFVDIGSYMRTMTARCEKDNISESEMQNEMFVLIFLCMINKKEYMTNDVESILSEIGETFLTDLYAKELREESMEEDLGKKEYLERIDGLYKDLGIDKKFFKEKKSIHTILDKIVVEDEKKLYKKMTGRDLIAPGGGMDMTTSEYFKFRSKVFDVLNSKFIGSYSQLNKLMGYSEALYDRVEIRKEEFDFILYHVLMSQDYNSVTNEETRALLVGMLYIYGFGMLYKDLKEKYLEKDKEEVFRKIEEEKKKVAESKKEYENKIDKYESEKRIQDNKIDKLMEEIEELKREKKKLEKELESRVDNGKEVVALRELAYRNTEEYIEENEENVKEKEMQLQEKRIVVVGGHPIWHAKLRDRFKGINTIAPEQVNLDISFLANADCIFVHSSYCNHSMYSKIMDVVRKSKVALGYTSSVNIDKNTEEMYEVICKQ